MFPQTIFTGMFVFSSSSQKNPGLVSHKWGGECQISEISDFDVATDGTSKFRPPVKSAGIDSTWIEHFRNPKIIEIRSQKKKLQHFEVGDFSKIPRSGRIFVQENHLKRTKTVSKTKKCGKRRKIFSN